MGFFKDSAQILGVCVGIIAIIVILITAASFILDYDSNPAIDNNKTMTLNGISITVPETNNYTVNDSTTLSYFDFNKNKDYSLNLDIVENFNTEGTAHEYRDFEHHIEIMVINSSDVPYIDNYDDGEVIDSVELDGRYFQQKKTLGDKVVLVWVYDDKGKSLAQKIINSAEKEK